MEERTQNFKSHTLNVSNRKLVTISGVNDVLSFDAETGKPVFIEVKTTNGSCNSAFYITRNELERSRVSDNYYLYRLYDYDSETDSYQILKISGDLSPLCVEPATYYVRIEE